MIGINEFGGRKISDIQVFEYTDTLSLPVSKTDYGRSHIGDIVKVGGIVGLLVTEIAATPEEIKKAVKAVEDAGGTYIPATKPTGGFNAPGYASVRIRGGVFKMSVKHSGAVKVGSPVYAEKLTDGRHAISTTKAADGFLVGYLYNALPAQGAEHVVPVIFDPTAR
jgi:hypothetical protein|nr:MAG TPA: hypothetical protein [Caudoviricetes sp.]